MSALSFSCIPQWSSDDLMRVRTLVADGHLIVLPTDTVYGIGADAAQPASVTALLRAKGRGRQMPPPVLVHDFAAAENLCEELSRDAMTLAELFWPGALTLIVRAREDLGWDLGETGGTIALRMPNHRPTLQLLATTGPLAVTSANLTGQPAATDIQDARAYFADNVAAYIDAGKTPGNIPSTIIDCAHGELRAVREGVLSLEELSARSGCTIAAVN